MYDVDSPFPVRLRNTVSVEGITLDVALEFDNTMRGAFTVDAEYALRDGFVYITATHPTRGMRTFQISVTETTDAEVMPHARYRD